MITTEASSTTMSWATAMMASARKRLGSRSGPVPKVGLGVSRVEVMVSPSPERDPTRSSGPAATALTWKGLVSAAPMAYNRNRSLGSL